MNTWPPPPRIEIVAPAHYPIKTGSLLRRFFAVPTGPRSLGAIIGWWEARRIVYNLVIGVVAMGGLGLCYVLSGWSGALQPGEDPVEPLLWIFAPLIWNIGYTAGWVGELLLRRVRGRDSRVFGPLCLGLGLIFSVGVVLLPAAAWGAACLVRLIRIA